MKRGFTLTEMLIVVGIIGVLAAILVPNLNASRKKSRDTKRMSELQQLERALELYKTQNGSYPVSTGCGATIPTVNWCNSVQSLAAGRWIKNSGSAALSGFIASDPVDPTPSANPPTWLATGGGTYYYFSDGTSYMLVFSLENYPNAKLENSDGVKWSDGTIYDYGSGSNGIITWGVSNR